MCCGAVFCWCVLVFARLSIVSCPQILFSFGFARLLLPFVLRAALFFSSVPLSVFRAPFCCVSGLFCRLFLLDRRFVPFFSCGVIFVVYLLYASDRPS